MRQSGETKIDEYKWEPGVEESGMVRHKAHKLYSAIGDAAAGFTYVEYFVHLRISNGWGSGITLEGEACMLI